MAENVVDRIDALLPQTQCTRCGYKDCRTYAKAVAASDTAINRCAPGGVSTITALSNLLQCNYLPLDQSFGDEETQPMVAFVREPECIGCYKCAAICPVDAFIGAPKRMHTVIESECTGCGLCLPVCPVDCVELRRRSVDNLLARDRAENSRGRYQARRRRLKMRESARKAARDSNRRIGEERETRIRQFLQMARHRARTKNGGGP